MDRKVMSWTGGAGRENTEGEAVADPSKKYSEEDWTDPESSTIDSYTKSKVVAEKAAWDYLKELPEEQKFELAVINPTLIMGPPLLEAHKSATSVNIMSGIVNKTYPGVPRVQFPVCDVRDVAKAHVKFSSCPSFLVPLMTSRGSNRKAPNKGGCRR
ncbi:putative uncharacterized oxidoreductase YDR541C [Chionoecetes opilio]|uniref:Uncharacterized oxidoreductase YDR541C n=1 Tax=Chionoecetes opilio TaxID=41210 RepID=A0A8J5CW49_CHIOP|nr:putative uncharacterized oxidoreductase YDR541C [Chionoecetes opilio]